MLHVVNSRAFHFLRTQFVLHIEAQLRFTRCTTVLFSFRGTQFFMLHMEAQLYISLFGKHNLYFTQCTTVLFTFREAQFVCFTFTVKHNIASREETKEQKIIHFWRKSRKSQAKPKKMRTGKNHAPVVKPSVWHTWWLHFKTILKNTKYT